MRYGKDSNELAKLQAEESWSTLVDAAVIQEAIFSKLVSSSVAKHVIQHLKVFLCFQDICDSKFKAVA